jgi:hypothetical protein
MRTTIGGGDEMDFSMMGEAVLGGEEGPQAWSSFN